MSRRRGQPDAHARHARAVGARRFFDGRARHDALGAEQRAARAARVDIAQIDEERQRIRTAGHVGHRIGRLDADGRDAASRARRHALSAAVPPRPVVSGGGGPNASSGVRPAAHNPARSSSSAPPVRTYASRCVLFAIFRCPESLSHFALFHQREGIVDFLHDDDALRRHASDDAVEKSIVHMRRVRFAVRALTRSATYELRLCMTPRNITSPVVSPASPVSFFPVVGSMPARQQAHERIAPSRGVVVYASAAGAGAGVAVAGAAGCGDAGVGGLNGRRALRRTPAPVAATNAAAMTPVFNAVVFTSVRLRARRRGFRGLEQHECRRHALDGNRRIGLAASLSRES